MNHLQALVQLEPIIQRNLALRAFHAEPVFCERCGTFIPRYTADRFVDLGEHVDFGDCERARDHRLLNEAIEKGERIYERLSAMTTDELAAFLGIDHEIEVAA